MTEKPTYLTEEGLKKLEEEYKQLKEEGIPEIAARIDDAKQLGDLSENAEYHSAKENMSWAQTRLAELDEMLRTTSIIQKQSNKTSVELGSTILVETEQTEKKYTIVGPSEVDPKEGKISHESPLGKAFLGKHPGDQFDVVLPTGIKKYLITSIQ